MRRLRRRRRSRRCRRRHEHTIVAHNSHCHVRACRRGWGTTQSRERPACANAAGTRDPCAKMGVAETLIHALDASYYFYSIPVLLWQMPTYLCIIRATASASTADTSTAKKNPMRASADDVDGVCHRVSQSLGMLVRNAVQERTHAASVMMSSTSVCLVVYGRMMRIESESGVVTTRRPE